MPSPHDAPQSKQGDLVVLLTGFFDPLHLDYIRAANSLRLRPKVGHIWLAPLSGGMDEHVRNMCTIAACDSKGLFLGVCTGGLDKKLKTVSELVAWCRKSFPYLEFMSATLASQNSLGVVADCHVVFASDAYCPDGEVIVIGEFLPVPADIQARIKSGSDEARNFQAPVWEYVQKRRLYR